MNDVFFSILLWFSIINTLRVNRFLFPCKVDGIYFTPVKNSFKISPCKVNYFGSPLDALFKSVILFNRFKKCCFLNQLFCSTDLKRSNSLHPRGDPKKFTLQGGNLKEIFRMAVKQKSRTLQG
jgi:hypothetical protein